MSLQVKIVMIAINLACLIITLLVPINITPLVLLPMIVSTVTWAFTIQAPELRNNSALFMYVLMASLVTTVCIVFGTTTSISKDMTYLSHYKMSFYPEIALLGNVSFDYAIFALFAFFSIFFLMIAEIIPLLIVPYDKKDAKYSNILQPVNAIMKQEIESVSEKRWGGIY